MWKISFSRKLILVPIKLLLAIYERRENRYNRRIGILQKQVFRRALPVWLSLSGSKDCKERYESENEEKQKRMRCAHGTADAVFIGGMRAGDNRRNAVCFPDGNAACGQQGI